MGGHYMAISTTPLIDPDRIREDLAPFGYTIVPIHHLQTLEAHSKELFELESKGLIVGQEKLRYLILHRRKKRKNGSGMYKMRASSSQSIGLSPCDIPLAIFARCLRAFETSSRCGGLFAKMLAKKPRSSS